MLADNRTIWISGDKLAQARGRKVWSQGQLSENSKSTDEQGREQIVSVDTIKKHEMKRATKMTFRIAGLLARALDLTPEQFAREMMPDKKNLRIAAHTPPPKAGRIAARTGLKKSEKKANPK